MFTIEQYENNQVFVVDSDGEDVAKVFATERATAQENAQMIIDALNVPDVLPSQNVTAGVP